MKKWIAIFLVLACCLSLFGCGKKEKPDPTQTPTTPVESPTEHQHSFSEWKLKTKPSCTKEGTEERTCSGCGAQEFKPVPMVAHEIQENNLCKNCMFVSVDPNASLVELGVICDKWYGAGNIANFAWDIKCWNGLVYRGAGDYDKNSGSTAFLAYDKTESKWKVTGFASDEAIHGYVEIGGTLYAAGIDPTAGWQYGNFYVLQENGTWKQVRNLPNGIHNFDMIEHDGKIFAGLGTEVTGQTVVMSEDGGKTFKFVPLYKDGSLMQLKNYKSSRTYEFVKYNNAVYALVRFSGGIGGEWAVFRYENGKMHYQSNGFGLFGGSVSRKYFGGEFEFNGACYIAAGALTVVTDFTDAESWQKIEMPGKEMVVDAFLRDGVIYTLATVQNRNPSHHNVESYRTVIYKSTTGQAGSFEEVLSFDYTATPLSFDYDGEYFYIGTGTAVDKSKTGMVLQAKAAS